MKLSKKQKRELLKIALGVILYVGAVVLTHAVEVHPALRIAAFMPAYLVLGLPIVIKAARNLLHGNMLDENFLMSIASVGAFILGECSEGVAVMLFDRVGEFFEDYAVSRSRKNIADLVDLCPDTALVLRDGQTVECMPDEVAVGETVIVLPGQKVPLDGVVTEGESTFDTSCITGESVPKTATAGERAVSGFINGQGKIAVRVEKAYEDSTVAKILSLIEDATEKKSKSEHLITRFARVYTPIVVACAAALAVIPSALHFAFPAIIAPPTEWIYRAMLFLVVSCPCALVISVPLSFFGGIGGASKHGVLIKGSNYLELLAKADTFVFDKTGTLTKGTFSVTQVVPEGMSEEELIMLAASAEKYSTHPIAKAIASAYNGQSLDGQVSELAGKGVCAQMDGSTVLVGNAALLKENGVEVRTQAVGKTAVYVARDGKYAGVIFISDSLKENAASCIAALNRVGKTVMLSGDSAQVAQEVAREAGIKEVKAELLPQDKVSHLEELRTGGVCAFCGDGMNDAPSLALADVGIAMGGVGSDAAIEAADVVIMDDDPLKIVTARAFASKTVRIVRQNIVFALGIKIGVMLLGAAGLASMWGAVFADVGVLILAVANSMRASRI